MRVAEKIVLQELKMLDYIGKQKEGLPMEELQLLPPLRDQSPTPPSSPPMQISSPNSPTDFEGEPLYLYNPVLGQYVLVENPEVFQCPDQRPSSPQPSSPQQLEIEDFVTPTKDVIVDFSSPEPSPKVKILFEVRRETEDDDDDEGDRFTACRKLNFDN